MAARSTLVLTDRAATPVAHNFTPDGDDANGVAVFSEKTGVPAGDARFTASLRQTNGKFRPTLKLQVPITQVQTINGISSPVVVRTSYAELNLTFDATSTTQERADVVGMIASALPTAQSMIDDLIVDMTPIW